MEMKKMEEITTQPIFYYGASDDEPRDLYVNVELSDSLFIKQEKAVIDRLMEKFYKEFMEAYIKEIKKI